MPPVSELMMFAGLLVIAGGVAGLLAGVFGIGGGAVLVPVFYQVFALVGIDDAVRMHLAVGTSLAIIVPTSLRSFAAHRRRGAVDMQLLKGWIIAVPLGAILAAVIAAKASSEALRLIFAIITLLLAFRMMFFSSRWHLGTDLPGEPTRFTVGTGIGVLSGLMGIGGGVLNNTFMSLYGRPIYQAVATSAGVGVLISLPGLFGYIWAGWGEEGLPPLSTGYINWIAVALIIPVTLIVAPHGAKLAHAMSKRQLEIGFGLFLLFVSGRFFYSLYG
ncbi:sulfite exporter TauE/SafE family protein [Rhizobium arsenicireducens]